LLISPGRGFCASSDLSGFWPPPDSRDYIYSCGPLNGGQSYFLPDAGSADEYNGFSFDGYVLISLALGLIFSATSATAAEAVQKTVLFSIPLVQMSGFAYAIRNMPTVFQWIAEVFPATHYIRVCRAIYIRGAGVSELVPELLFLGVSGAILIGLALRTIEARS